MTADVSAAKLRNIQRQIKQTQTCETLFVDQALMAGTDEGNCPTAWRQDRIADLARAATWTVEPEAARLPADSMRFPGPRREWSAFHAAERRATL